MGVLQDDWLDGQLPRATGNQQVSGSNDSEASGGGGGRTWLPWAASSPALLLDKECCIGPPDVCVCFLHFSSLERDSFGWRAPDLLRGSVAFDIVGVNKGVAVGGCTTWAGRTFSGSEEWPCCAALLSCTVLAFVCRPLSISSHCG